MLYDHGAGAPPREAVIDSPALPYMIQMMRQVIASGTGGRAKVPGYDLAGKTGTTSDYRDAWFIGYTGGFTAAVWVGKDNNTPMAKVTGGAAPSENWHDFMAAALPRLAAQPIPGGEARSPGPSDAIGDILGNGGLPPSGDGEAPPDPSAPTPQAESSDTPR